MIPEFIQKKRKGYTYKPEEIQEFIRLYLKGDVQDYHMSAWLMAVCFQGMSMHEIEALTYSMWKSGECLKKPKQYKFLVDKHSTGGVGDKTSLMLIPWLKAVIKEMGDPHLLAIPMISGRGLGHTGGTLDKLESIPGFTVRMTKGEAELLLSKNGAFFIGQTQELAPADRRIYALRDVTSTVESVPLIVSSILSKKLSASLDGLVLDVKFGEGAFCENIDQAEKLGRALVHVASLFVLKAQGVITEMDNPLGRTTGHVLEVKECWEWMCGEKVEPGQHEVTLELASRMLVLATKNSIDINQAKALCEKVWKAGKVSKEWVELVQAQGGDWGAFLKIQPPLEKILVSTQKGYLKKIHSKKVANLLHSLGGARAKVDDQLDLGVGIELMKQAGDFVQEGEPLAKIYHRGQEIGDWLENTFEWQSQPIEKTSKIFGVIENG